MNEAPRVTIAGGGVAGLTAALRLAERGYRVKLYEQKPTLGGNLGSRRVDGGYLDVYPHMYLNWYHNFWRLLADAGVERRKRFAPVPKVGQLERGQFPRFTELTDMYSASHMFDNLFSGVGPAADMFVYGYASVDLLAERLNPMMNVHGMTLNSFLRTRPYMTERAAAAYDSFVTTVWAVSSKLVSAADYRRFLEYSVAEPSPDLWLARGPAGREVIDPITVALEAAGAELSCSVQVTGVSCTNGRVDRIALQRTEFDPASQTWIGTGEQWTDEVDELILALPPTALARVVRAGDPGRRLVDAAPELAGVSHLRAQNIPILNLYFTRRLASIPAEPVGLFGSRLALAFTDISQVWDGDQFGNRTVLAASASDPDWLAGPTREDDGLAIVEELAKYLDFEAGASWGDSNDVDWERTRYDPNLDSLLFVNETGSEDWRPAADCEELANVAFAGDFCRGRIGMATIEAGVTSGLEAAGVIVQRRGFGDPVQIAEPSSLPAALYLWLLYAWAPYAAAAKAWSMGSDCKSNAPSLLRRLLTPTGPYGAQRRDS
jgi:hypothetical protein